MFVISITIFKSFNAHSGENFEEEDEEFVKN